MIIETVITTSLRPVRYRKSMMRTRIITDKIIFRGIVFWKYSLVRLSSLEMTRTTYVCIPKSIKMDAMETMEMANDKIPKREAPRYLAISIVQRKAHRFVKSWDPISQLEFLNMVLILLIISQIQYQI